jgi:uncharacterized repeat protein (TIGR03803 family)
MKIISTIAAAATGLALLTAMPASAATLVTLASFDNTNGASPRGGLTIDAAGNIYGGASQGGINTSGVVFKIDAGTSTMTTIARFNGTNGAGPIGGVAMDAAGNLYGATQTGGAGGLGTIYRIDAGTNTITTLAAFRNGDGANPWGRVTLDAAGNIYGTTASGGATNQGTVFRLAAGATSITTLASFTGPNGSMPYAPLVIDTEGNLFGTASSGGAGGRGTIFKVAAGTNAVTTLADFGNTTGYTPNGGLMLDDAGNLYGTTVNGGKGSGNVFRIDAGTSTITSIAEFGFGNPNPANPYSGLIMDAVGNLFGTTFSGGTAGNGTIFRIDAGTNNIVTLASFSGQPEGRGPYNAEGLVADANGNLYGTTWRGGEINRGTVFRLSDAGFVTAASMSPVPEPASWAMMMTGFGLVGSTLRRRRHRTTAVAA